MYRDHNMKCIRVSVFQMIFEDTHREIATAVPRFTCPKTQEIHIIIDDPKNFNTI